MPTYTFVVSITTTTTTATYIIENFCRNAVAWTSTGGTTSNSAAVSSIAIFMQGHYNQYITSAAIASGIAAGSGTVSGSTFT